MKCASPLARMWRGGRHPMSLFLFSADALSCTPWCKAAPTSLVSRSGPSGGTAVLVARTGPPDIAELWDWRLAPGEVHESEPHTSGTRKLLLVLEGTIELKAGQDTQRLAAGDSASFRSDVADSYGNPASPG